MHVLVCDNYDSFTFNLVQHLGEIGANVRVERNDAIDVDGLDAVDAVVISPGPGRPSDAGTSVALVEWCARTSTPLLGVCLGHQAIGEAFGAKVSPAPAVMHGKTSVITHDGDGVFRGLPAVFDAMRYHSLVLDASTLPDELIATAWTDDVLMGVRHATLPIEGVQFHPESVLTEHGTALLRNFLGR